MDQREASIFIATHAVGCPFCGSTELELIDLDTVFWISCKVCTANGPSGDSAEQALERWNWVGHVDE